MSDHSIAGAPPDQANELLQLLLKIALRYINVPLVQAEQTINLTLQEMGDFVQADRVYIFDYDFTANNCSNTHEWCAQGISPEIDNLQCTPLDFIPQWIQAHRAGQEMYIADVPGLPDGDGLKDILHPQGIKSILTIPMVNENELLGFVGFDSVRQYHVYSEQERTLLAVFAQMLVNIKSRIRTLHLLSVEKEKAQQAAQAKSDFLANMSHELRTPLNAIIGFTELISFSSLQPMQRDYLNKIHQSSTLLLSLINDILDFSKVESGKLELHPEPYHLSAIVRQLTDLFSQAALNKNLQLIFNLDPKLPDYFLLDPLRLTQILTNLLSNAIKFTEQGQVSCHVQLVSQLGRATRVNFSVADTGIGITAAQITKLCQAFTQADSSITRRYGGTGLGLAISNLLLEQMYSKLHIESTSGVGSRFSFEVELLQVEQPLAPAKAPSLTESTASDFSGYRVMVVEDNSTNRLVIKKMLERLGLTVSLAEHGAEAVAKLIAEKPDLIFMDLQMPVMDGFAATKLIKQQLPDLPVIALSAAVLDEDRAMAKAAGVDAHLAKPVTTQQIINTLQQWLAIIPKSALEQLDKNH